MSGWAQLSGPSTKYSREKQESTHAAFLKFPFRLRRLGDRFRPHRLFLASRYSGGAVIIWGRYAFIDGIATLASVFRPASGGTRFLPAVSGIIGVIAGLVAIFQPVSSAVALAWVLGIWFVVRGVVEVISAFAHPQPGPRWMTVIGGVLWIVAGALFVANPGASALAISLWLGALAIMWGIMLVAAGFAVRSAAKKEHVAEHQPIA